MLYILLLLLVVAFFSYITGKAFGIVSGYGAKVLCSAVFVCERNSDDVIKNELGSFPFSLGTYIVNVADRSATGSVYGLAKRKAVFRNGLGAVLVHGSDEDKLRKQFVDLPSFLQANRDNVDWPSGDRIDIGGVQGVDYDRLHTAVDFAFDEINTPSTGTRAIVVVYNGNIVAERYAENFSANSKLAGWSMAKSVTSALLGVLAKEGKIDLDAALPITDWQKDKRKNITLTHLLQMCSGLRWWEYYAAPSDVTNMLYNEKNMGEFAQNKVQKHPPGTIFNYSSGTTNILSAIIRKVVKGEDYYLFPYQQLFYKIGMSSAVMEADASGTFVGSSYCFATARDWGRFGLLYLNDGVWNGERILPEGWVKFTSTATSAKCKPDEGRYGAHWWVNASKSNEAAGRKYPDVPEDCFYCQGYEGQNIWVVPSKKLVVVRLALQKRTELDPNIFLSGIVKSIEH